MQTPLYVASCSLGALVAFGYMLIDGSIRMFKNARYFSAGLYSAGLRRAIGLTLINLICYALLAVPEVYAILGYLG